MEVYTAYPIWNAVIRHSVISNSVPASQRSSMVVTLLGGTITINGLTYTRVHEALPSLEPGQEYLLLLRRVGDRYFLAADYYGAFQISGSVATNRVQKRGFAEELNRQ